MHWGLYAHVNPQQQEEWITRCLILLRFTNAICVWALLTCQDKQMLVSTNLTVKLVSTTSPNSLKILSVLELQNFCKTARNNSKSFMVSSKFGIKCKTYLVVSFLVLSVSFPGHPFLLPCLKCILPHLHKMYERRQHFNDSRHNRLYKYSNL